MDDAGDTPVDWAPQAGDNGSTPFIVWVNICNAVRDTPLHHAATNTLLEAGSKKLVTLGAENFPRN